MFPSVLGKVSGLGALMLAGLCACGAPDPVPGDPQVPQAERESGPAADDRDPDALPDLDAAIAQLPQGDTFASLWALVGQGARPVVSAEEATAGVTVLAPTDAAFDALPDGALEALRAGSNRAALRSLLRYHVLQGQRDRRALQAASAPLETLAGGTITPTVVGEAVDLGGAILGSGGIETENGFVHPVDSVLLPPATDASGG